MNRRTYGTRLSTLEQRMADTEEALAERLGTLMTDLLRGVLDDLGLTDEQRAIASEAVPRHLAEMKDAIARGGTE